MGVEVQACNMGKSGNCCDLCNEDREVIEGTFFKRSDSGGLAHLCRECWEKLDAVDNGCCLCRGDVPEEPKRRHSICVNAAPENAEGGPVCNDCRRILDWNHA